MANFFRAFVVIALICSIAYWYYEPSIGSGAAAMGFIATVILAFKDVKNRSMIQNFYLGSSKKEVKALLDARIEKRILKLEEKSNFLIEKRLSEFKSNFIIKLTEENPSGIQQFENPDFRDAVSGAQKDYAKNADKDIGDLLVNLLIERTKKENRDLAQIVLNESLRIVPKLINEHLAVLSAVFFVQNYYKEIRLDHKELQHLLDESLGKISNEIIPGYSCFRHLEFTGCGSSGKTGVRGIEQYITLRYKGLFFTSSVRFNELLKR